MFVGRVLLSMGMLGCGRSGSCVYDHSGNRVEDLFKRVMTILLACLLPFASTF